MSENSNKAPVQFNKNDYVTVEITDIGNDGEGIGRFNGYTLFIKDAVIGDKVRAKIMKAKKNYAYAHLEEVLEPSSVRTEPRCPVARACGGCQTQNMSYERELAFKQDKVRNNLVRLGGFDNDFITGIMEPIIGMEDPWRYRNKAQYPIGKDKNGRIVAGFYAGRTHSIIPVEDCLIGDTKNKDILQIILQHLNENNIEPYDEETGKGLVRHVLIRKGFHSKEVMVCLVLNYTGKTSGNPEFMPKQAELVEKLSRIQGMTSISVSINTEKTNVIMGSRIHTIWGRDTISDVLCGLKFEISPLSFYQVNPVQAQKLYQQAVKYAGLTGKETVWDLYCGIGTITLSMAGAAGFVYGVEIIPDAIEDAKRNAVRNGIENVQFYCGKAEEVLPAFYEKGAESGQEKALHPDVIVVDPPRKGCDENCLATMLKMSPGKIVYVSCDSATLARDLRILTDGGYKLTAVRTCDMFCHTVHVETVVLLSQQKPDEHVSIKIDLDELDETSAETKATYEKIKTWVQDKYGFKVSTLDIAKVKRLNGIIERENYNKPKSENSVKRTVTPEKQRVITEALKHFKMI